MAILCLLEEREGSVVVTWRSGTLLDMMPVCIDVHWMMLRMSLPRRCSLSFVSVRLMSANNNNNNNNNNKL